MVWFSRNDRRLFFFLCILCCSWTIKTHQSGLCDQFYSGIYCNCDSRRGETTVVCYLTGNLSIHDEVWNLMGKVEDMVSLTIYSMQGVMLTYIPTDSLRRINSLRVLVAKQASFGVLKTDAVSGMNELRELKLDGSEITQLETKAISNLPKLKVLSLSENMLQEVLADTFVGLDELEKLFLDKNNISRVESCAFCNLQSLRDLDLFGNQITDLSEYMFRGLRFLNRLDLYRNQIRILNDKVFHPMPKLLEIDLKDNLISHIAPNAFQGLDNLQSLMLNSNRIKTLPDQVFKPLPNLRTLDLYNNELETLQVEVIEGLMNVNDGHFAFSFTDNNPFKCDCRLEWVSKYLTTTKSHQFRNELKRFQCLSDNGEDQNQTSLLVHELKLDCDIRTPTTKYHTTASATRLPIRHSAKKVPSEIQDRKSKAITTTSTADEEPLVQDSEPKEEPLPQDNEPKEMTPEEVEDKDNGSVATYDNVKLIVFMSLWTILFVQRLN